MTGHALSADDRCVAFEDLGIRDYVSVLDLQTTAREEMIQDPVLGNAGSFCPAPGGLHVG